jgi:glycosyltransferase involved in cell wall biosynthesis
MDSQIMEKIKETPLISIVIPLYNKEKVVEKTLKSIQQQTFTAYELVIVNDGSTDRSREAVLCFIENNRDFANSIHIRIIDQENRGLSGARNRGIQEAKGDYIALTDADDEWLPTYMIEMRNLIVKYPDCSLFASAYYYRDPSKPLKEAPISFDFEGDCGVIHNFFQMAMKGDPPIMASGVILRKSVILAENGFPTHIRFGEDYITWAKLACKYKIAYSKRPLAIYNRLPESYETGSYNSMKIVAPKDDIGGTMLMELYRINRDIEGLYGYCKKWHKGRLVMLTNAGRRVEAFQEWVKSLPVYIFNLDCYYRLFLNLLPFKGQIFVKRIVGKE